MKIFTLVLWFIVVVFICLVSFDWDKINKHFDNK